MQGNRSSNVPILNANVPTVCKKPLTARDFKSRLKSLTLPTHVQKQGAQKQGAQKHYVLGVSGGADSLAMMVLAAKIRAIDTPHFKFSVATVDHGLRAGARKEALYVARLARQYGLPHKILTHKGAIPKADIQAAARAIRYDLLLGYCAQKKADGLVLAHHLEDQAETFLLRLARGSGVDGLSAMQAVSMRDGYPLLRPFLDVPKARLGATVAAEGLTPVTDESNTNTRFARVKIRAAMPALAEIGLDATTLAATAARLASSRRTLAEMTRIAADNLLAYDALGIVSLERAGFRQLPTEIGIRLLRWLLTPSTPQLAGKTDNYPPRQQAVERIYDAIMQDGIAARTLNGFALRLRAKEVLIHREAAACAGVSLTLKAGERAVWDGRFEVKLARGFSGETQGKIQVTALGVSGVQKLRDGGVTLPNYAPAGALHSLAAVWCKRKLLAVAGLDFVTGDKADIKSGVKIDILPQKHDIN